MLLCVCPYVFHSASLCLYAYALMMIRMCPYIMQVNSVVKIFNDLVYPRDQLFEDRHEKLIQAVETVNREIPATDSLNKGDMDETIKCLLPIVEAVYYDMPDLRPESGSERWIEYMKKNIDQATFHDLNFFTSIQIQGARKRVGAKTDQM